MQHVCRIQTQWAMQTKDRVSLSAAKMIIHFALILCTVEVT